MAAISTGPILSSSFRRFMLRWPRQFHSLNPTPSCLYHLKTNRNSIYFVSNAVSGASNWASAYDSHHVGYTRKVFDKLPQPIKTFPWTKALGIFRSLLFGLVSTVAKYIFLPLLAISSLSEMAYCAIERKIWIVPVSFLCGFSLFTASKDSCINYFPNFKEGGKPWHFVPIAAFLLLLKLVGPYYPYFLRLWVPHFANGGLWCILLFVFRWYRGHLQAT